jgi:MATE family multidrug resistance protein
MPNVLFSTDTSAETRRLLALAWPVMLTSLNWTILHVTDVIVVGLVGAHEVAALGASRSLTFIAIVTGLAWLSGVLVHAARADGAGDLPRTGQVLREGLVLGLLLGLVVGGIMLAFADAMLAGIGVAPALVAPAGRVVRVMALTYPPQLMIVAASFFLEGVSRPPLDPAAQRAARLGDVGRASRLFADGRGRCRDRDRDCLGSRRGRDDRRRAQRATRDGARRPAA